MYAKGNEAAREHMVVNAGVRIIAHTLDLEAEAEALLESVRVLTNEMMLAVTSIAQGEVLRFNRFDA